LNSRLLDWLFRRFSVPFQNQFWSANKQFISGLPIRVPEDGAVAVADELGRRLHGLATSLAAERGGFLDWLSQTVGTTTRTLPGRRALERYELLTAGDVVEPLGRAHARLSVDPRERSVRDLIGREHAASVDRLLPLLAELRAAEMEADNFVYELYRLPGTMRSLVDSEYAGVEGFTRPPDR